MKIYLAGPMSIVPETLNFPAFFETAKRLENEGHQVFNPAQADLDKWGDLETVKREANYRDCLETDMIYICREAEAIAFLPGWEQSKGCLAEWATAKAIGLKFIYL